ncbi:MAG TPA: lysozyme inhibitor LprI family protein [Flavisolibacter sp.]|jgi:uncharacterized protein YecT (DUF1311 family)
MKKVIYSILLIFISSYSFSQTQLEVNEAEHKKFLKADKELNQVYQTIIKEYKGDTVFIKNPKVSQRLWIQFRDAEMKMMYPDREPGYYGSIHPMCWSIYKTDLTNERIKKLKIWLAGQEEGDSCSPSIKVK